MVLKEIPIPAWPNHYSDAYNLFQLSPFNENGYIFSKSSFMWLGDKFVTKTHLKRYQIISSIVFSSVLTNSVPLILSAVVVAVFRLLIAILVIINVQTVLGVIVFLFLS